MESELKFMLIPKDPNDDKNVIVEIRAGTGGDEAALFGGNLLRMYTRYAERHSYKIEVMSSNMTELGGVKEIILLIAGRGAYSRLKFESGVHRVTARARDRIGRQDPYVGRNRGGIARGGRGGYQY